MIFLNGQFLPDEQATVSVSDRGFLYGDGLFETIRVYGGKLFRWDDHMERLQRGADFLRLRIPFAPAALLSFAQELIEANAMPDSLLRLAVSRGAGKRGYSPQGALCPTVVISQHSPPVLDALAPPRWRLAISSVRVLSADPLAQVKTANKLPRILARIEAEEAGADEALLLNEHGAAVEASSANLFWVENGIVCTPPKSAGALAGITRVVVLELCEQLHLPSVERTIPPEDLRRADGIFLTLTGWEIVEVMELDRQPINQSPLTKQLWATYRAFARGSATRVHDPRPGSARTRPGEWKGHSDNRLGGPWR